MKVIKDYKTVEEIKGYEACDGTMFDNEEECKKYENTAKAVIKGRFKKLVIKELEGIEITKEGSAFPMASIDEDWYYALVKIEDEDDYNVALMFQEITGCTKHGFNKTMIGKKILVSIGGGIYPRPSNGNVCAYDNCYVFGTIEDMVREYETALRKLEGGN